MSGLLDVDYFSRQVGVDLFMAPDGAAVVGDRAGITFGVELVVPWDAPEAVVDLFGRCGGLGDDPGRYWPGWSAAGYCRMSSSAGKRCAQCACSGSGFAGAGTEFSRRDNRGHG